MASRALPVGDVTLVFTDIEGSTSLLTMLGERYADLLHSHRRVLRAAFEEHGGVEVGTEGDSFFVAFPSAADAVAAAVDLQRGLAAATWPDDVQVRVRVGVHSGRPAVVAGDYIGLDVHRAARIMSAAHGGQVVVSQTTVDADGRRPAGRRAAARPGRPPAEGSDAPAAPVRPGDRRPRGIVPGAADAGEPADQSAHPGNAAGRAATRSWPSWPSWSPIPRRP